MSSIIEQKNEVKLDLLKSLARSQKALARIIETVSIVTEVSPETARKLADHIYLIEEYQRNLTRKLTGIKVYDRKSKEPSAPWLSSGLIDKSHDFCINYTLR